MIGRCIGAVAIALWLACPAVGQVQVDFETMAEFPTGLGVEARERAGDHGGALTAAGTAFHGYHHVDGQWDWWGGYSVSNRTVVAGGDFLKEYTCVPGTDHTVGAGGTYAIGYDDWESGYGCLVDFPQPTRLDGAWFTQVVYTAEWIVGNYGPADYYKLRITAYDDGMEEIAHRDLDLTAATDWVWCGMGWDDVSSLGVTMNTSDSWTPTYFALDDINVPEPSAAVLLGLGGLLALPVRRRRAGR